ncbi:MAG: lipoyl(octanoyl) transferase LipB [Bacteroidetes bacterium]|nr:MAG: lipoyl(octanoyl) transferase LipB [Bacteroidota bacterium]
MSVLYKKNNLITYNDLGLMRYADAWAYQDAVFKEIVAQKIANRELDFELQTRTQNFIFTCEHPHVYTLGKSGKMAHFLLNNTELEQKKVDFFETNRGGDITYHGPGQIVIYPVLDLENFFTDIHKYLRFLEEAVIDTLQIYSIEAGRIDGLTGVWIGMNTDKPRKICAMGIRSSRWVAMHGLALNVNTDLDFFNHIVPCGIADKAVTSIKNELGKHVDIEQVKKELVAKIITQFGMKLLA